MIINTEGMTFDAWAIAVTQQLAMHGDAVPADTDEDWKEWAYKVLLLPFIGNQRAPRPGHFDSWRDWADAFNRAVDY